MKSRTFVIISLLFLAITVPLSVYLLVNAVTNLEISAEAQTIPSDVTITALSSNSFTLEWDTEAEFAGYIYYGTTPTEMKLLGQDIKGNSKFKEHKITVTGLTADTTYYYLIVSEEDKYQSGEKPFEIKTLSE